MLMAVLAPVLAGLGIALTGRAGAARMAWTAAGALSTFALVTSLFLSALGGDVPRMALGELVPGLEVMFRADAAGLIFAFSATALWVPASSFAFGYMAGAREVRQRRFFACFAICIGSTVGLAFAGNLFTFFVFYELLTLATYPLVVHTQSAEALRAGRRYLVTLLGGGSFLLLAVVLVQANAPGEEFQAGGYLDGTLSDAGIVALVVLAVLGFGTKAAIIPLHRWLPAAMVAPTPVSALLHAVAVVKAGIFGFVRMFGFVIGPGPLAEVGAGVVVAGLASATVVAASVIAFRQDSLKARLAYSTVAHLSYMVLGLALLSASAWNGALLHLVNHAVLKITLFFCAGAIYVHTGVTNVSQMDGIGRRMPVTMAAFAVASLGLAGVPPVGGFVSKWFLGAGAIEAGQPVLAVVVLGSGLLTAGYLLPVVHRAFFRTSEDFTVQDEAPASMVAPLTITALAGLALGLGDVVGLGGLARDVSAAVTGGSL